MRLTFFFFILLLAGCGNHASNSDSVKMATSVNQSSKSNIYKGLISQKVKDYLKDSLPEWSVPDISDYSKVWWSFYDRSQLPYYVTTDINDDNLSDYAFILKNKNTIRLFILLSKGDTFIRWTADYFEEKYKGTVKDIQFGIVVAPPGRTDCVFENKKESTLLLKSNGIALMALEQKCAIYYWDKGEFRTFRILANSSEFIVK